MKLVLHIDAERLSDYGAPRSAIVAAIAELLEDGVTIERLNMRDDEDDEAEYALTITN